jgi:hypothetical protein
VIGGPFIAADGTPGALAEPPTPSPAECAIPTSPSLEPGRSGQLLRP